MTIVKIPTFFSDIAMSAGMPSIGCRSIGSAPRQRDGFIHNGTAGADVVVSDAVEGGDVGPHGFEGIGRRGRDR